MIYSIYIVRFKNSKVYIGMTSRKLKSRKLEHESISRSDKGNYFHNALKKYKNVKWEVIYQSKDFDHIKEMETKFIKLYKSNIRKFGYNLTLGGEGILGLKHKKETILKLIAAGKKAQKLHNNYKYLEMYYDANPEARSKAQKEWYLRPENKDFAKKRRKQSIKKYGNKAGKPKKQITLEKDGKEYNFKSLSSASKELNVSIAALSKLKKKGNGQVKGYNLILGETTCLV